MLKIKLLFVIALFFYSLQNSAQTVLLNVDRTNERVYDRGPNQKKFTQAFIKFGFVIPPDEEGARIKYGGSVSCGFGVRKKFKVSSLYSLGWEIQIEFTDYKLKQDSTKIFSAGKYYDTQRIDVTSLGVGVFNRLNLDPQRGNYMGYYLDLGLTGRAAFSTKEVYKYNVGYGDATVKVNHLNYANYFHADAFVRMGLSRLSVWATYRISNLFKEKAKLPELPRIIVGIELGLY